MNTATIRFEDNAERRTVTLEGWACKTCGRLWPDKNPIYADGQPHPEEAERMAHWCCATDLPCACGGRNTDKSYTVCATCRARNDNERYLALPEYEWDGLSPLVSFRGDTYYFDGGDGAIQDLLEDNGWTLDDLVKLQLVEAVSCHPREFDVNEFLQDILPEDVTVIDDGISTQVNDWIEKQMPISWEEGSRRPSIASLQKHLTP